MLRKLLILSCAGFFVISLSGCTTARRHSDVEIESLKNQISLLEGQLQAKDEEIYSPVEALTRGGEFQASPRIRASKKSTGEVKSRPKVKQIQMALQNAGYNPGLIDGRMGKQTRAAIRQFQAAHNLAVDGKVGKMTWRVLKDYLYKKVK